MPALLVWVLTFSWLLLWTISELRVLYTKSQVHILSAIIADLRHGQRDQTMCCCKLPPFPQLKSSEPTVLLQEDCIIPDAVEIKIILHCNTGFFTQQKPPATTAARINNHTYEVQIQYMFYHYFAGICFVWLGSFISFSFSKANTWPCTKITLRVVFFQLS